MAVTQTDKKIKAWINVNVGTTTTPKYQNQNLGSGYIINPLATDTDIHGLGDRFAALQSKTLEKIQFDEMTTLVNS